MKTSTSSTSQAAILCQFRRSHAVRLRALRACFFALMVAALIPAQSSRAGLSFIGNAYAESDPNGSGTTYYKVDPYNGALNPAFSPNLNGLTIAYGQSLLLGGQVQTYQPGPGTSADLWYKVDGGTFAQMNLPYYQTASGNDWWDQAAATSGVNIGNGLSVGTHTLSIYYAGTQDGTTSYDNNNGLNWSATFQVTAVPEPVNVALGLFGVLFAGVTAARWRLKQLRSANSAN